MKEGPRALEAFVVRSADRAMYRAKERGAPPTARPMPSG
jgi:GGDEF domain-containing protein